METTEYGINVILPYYFVVRGFVYIYHFCYNYRYIIVISRLISFEVKTIVQNLRLNIFWFILKYTFKDNPKHFYFACKYLMYINCKMMFKTILRSLKNPLFLPYWILNLLKKQI